MNSFFRDIVRYVDQMGTQEYFIAVAIAIAIGYFCLKGFGSRAEY